MTHKQTDALKNIYPTATRGGSVICIFLLYFTLYFCLLCTTVYGKIKMNVSIDSSTLTNSEVMRSVVL